MRLTFPTTIRQDYLPPLAFLGATFGSLIFLVAVLLSNNLSKSTLAPQPVPTSLASFGHIHEVTISAEKADPAIVLVKPGEMVRLINADSKGRKIEQADPSSTDHPTIAGGLSTDILKPNHTFRIKFSQPGTYYFKDFFNPHINLTVEVKEEKK